jgi:DNA replication protein DnaC
MKKRPVKVLCQGCGQEVETVSLGSLTRRYCDDCAEVKAMKDEMDRLAREEAYIEAKYREMVADAKMPKKWQPVTFANSDPNLNEVAFQIARNYAESFNIESRTLVLYSSGFGCGKTHLAACIANHVLHELRRPVIFEKARDLLLNIRRTFSDPDNSEADILDQVLPVDLMVLDDVGLDKPSNWVESTYWTIFDRRLESGLPMVVTTNYAIEPELTQEGLADRIGYGAMSRLMQMCNGEFIDLTGPDLR